MNFRTLALNIRQFCPQLSIPVIKQRINIRYRQILAAEKWEFLNESTVVRLRKIYAPASTVATIAVNPAQVTVTGTGTTMATENVGWNFRVNSEPQPYVIASVNSATEFLLEANYAGTTVTAGTFELFKSVYSPVVGDVAEITSIVYQDELDEISLSELNRLDPERSSTGEPQKWCNISKTTAAGGIASFEIWPVSDDDYAVTVNYKKKISDLSLDTDAPVFRPELLEAGALWDCYRQLYSSTQNPAFVGLARDARADYHALLRDMILEDLQTASLPSKVRVETQYRTVDDNFRLSHDVD